MTGRHRVEAPYREGLTAGRVEMLLIAESAGAPAHALPEVEAVAGRGLAGDRYFNGLGHWSDAKWPDQELTLFEAEVARGLGLGPEAFRRNLVVTGVRLETLLHRQFRLGDQGPVLYGVRPCDPCAYIEAFTRAGVVHDLAGIRGGLRARILEGGRIAVGDAVVMMA